VLGSIHFIVEAASCRDSIVYIDIMKKAISRLEAAM